MVPHPYEEGNLVPCGTIGDRIDEWMPLLIRPQSAEWMIDPRELEARKVTKG